MNGPEQHIAPPAGAGSAVSDASVAQTLVAVVRRLSSARALDEIMEVVTQAARRLLQADGITFVLREGDWCHYAEEDAIAPLWKGLRFPIDACISGWCMIERKPAVISDIYQDDRIPGGAYRPTFVHSLAMVPVRPEDPLAAMGAYWAKRRHPSAPEVQLLQSIADAAALAIAFVQSQRPGSAPVADGAPEKGLLDAEREHRVRNTLATVQSIVNRSLSGDPERAGVINRRIAALLASDDVLDSEDVAPSEIRDTLADELAPFGLERILLDGVAVGLLPDRAKALAVVVHELATNAAKYGALSAPGGHLAIVWRVSGDAVRLTWTESDGPPVAAPAKRGFGSYFVQQVLAGIEGTIDTEMRPSGVVHKIGFSRCSPPDPGHLQRSGEGQVEERAG